MAAAIEKKYSGEVLFLRVGKELRVSVHQQRFYYLFHQIKREHV